MMTAPGDRHRHTAAVTAYIATHVARAHDSSGDEGSSWFRTGSPSDELNGVLRVAGDLPVEIERLRKVFDGIPACWHFWPGIDSPEVPELFAQQGFSLFETEPIMVYSDADRTAPRGRRESARIEEVTDDAGLARWAALWADTPDTKELVDGLRQGLERASTRYLVWREHGEVLGCAAVVTSDAGASIEHIVTRADHRGRGIGTALTECALDLALESRTAPVILTASPDGEQIYRRLGFVTVGYVERYA